MKILREFHSDRHKDPGCAPPFVADPSASILALTEYRDDVLGVAIGLPETWRLNRSVADESMLLLAQPPDAGMPSTSVHRLHLFASVSLEEIVANELADLGRTPSVQKPIVREELKLPAGDAARLQYCRTAAKADGRALFVAAIHYIVRTTAPDGGTDIYLVQLMATADHIREYVRTAEQIADSFRIIPPSTTIPAGWTRHQSSAFSLALPSQWEVLDFDGDLEGGLTDLLKRFPQFRLLLSNLALTNPDRTRFLKLMAFDMTSRHDVTPTLLEVRAIPLPETRHDLDAFVRTFIPMLFPGDRVKSEHVRLPAGAAVRAAFEAGHRNEADLTVYFLLRVVNGSGTGYLVQFVTAPHDHRIDVAGIIQQFRFSD